MTPIRWLLKRAMRRASHEILAGRLIVRNRPEPGRFLHRDVNAILEQTWRHAGGMLPQAELERLPTTGNRTNVFLAVLSTAAYRALVDAGVEREYASELVADVGWKVFARLVSIPKWVARLLARNPQQRINLVLRMLMVYPFSSQERPGYECKAWAEADRFCTDWTFCPPYEFVRRYVEKHGDRGEIEAFRRSWCGYDWALTYELVDGRYGERGHYERPHTLSSGDPTCDMRWYALPPPTERGLLPLLQTKHTRAGGPADIE
jgi:hypothetical protein